MTYRFSYLASPHEEITMEPMAAKFIISPAKLHIQVVVVPHTQCGGSGMFIPDPGSDFFHPGSRFRTVSIPDPGSASKNLSVLTPKKWFLSSRKYDPGCSSRIPDPDADFYPSRIPDPGSRGQKGNGSRIRIRNTAHT